MRRGFKRLVGSLEFLKTATGVLISALGLLIGTGAGIASYLGVRNIRDLHDVVITQGSLNGAQKRFLAHNLMDNTEEGLRNVTLLQPFVEPSVVATAQRDSVLLEKLQASESGGDSVDTVLSLLKRLDGALVELAAINAKDVAQLNKLSGALDDIARWITTLKMTDPDLSGFLRRCGGYIENVQGILELQHPRLDKKDDTMLDKAEARFKASNATLPRFSRPLSNLGVVAGRRCVTVDDLEARQKCLDRVPAIYNSAFGNAETSSERATVFNNLAFAYLRMARVNYARKQYATVETTLKSATLYAKQAEAQPIRYGTAYETEAQIEALQAAARWKASNSPQPLQPVYDALVNASMRRVDGTCDEYLAELLREEDFTALGEAAGPAFAPATVCNALDPAARAAMTE